jgi:hypothetical protein
VTPEKSTTIRSKVAQICTQCIRRKIPVKQLHIPECTPSLLFSHVEIEGMIVPGNQTLLRATQNSSKWARAMSSKAKFPAS